MSLSVVVDSVASRLKPLAGKRVGTLVIHELYRSIQGESSFAGLPCTFVRLTACQLRCTYCDTPHAFQQGQTFTVDEVFHKVLALGDSVVEITGGEPLLQDEVYPLMTRLCDAGKTVLLETGGALSIAQVDPRVRTILDLKTPRSGEVAANDWTNLALLKPTDEVKFVVCDHDDFDWSAEIIREHDLTTKCPVLVSGAYGQVDPGELAGWVLDSGLNLRYQLQLHKILWGAKARGV